MGLLQTMRQFPVMQKITVLILFVTVLLQFCIMLYFRISPPLTRHQASATFEKVVGNITDIPATLNQKNSENLPYAARIPHGNPRYYQMERGTCWDFALIGMIQNDYRQHGIKKGFLKDEEYVSLSQQVLGIRMVEHCNKHPDVCNTPGDALLLNSTSGGEINWFYSFTKLYSEMLPDSVCPYEPTDAGEFKCDLLENATKSNPIRFNVTKMNIAYTVNDTKKLFINKGKRALAWTSLIHDDFEYFPCSKYPEFCNLDKYEKVKCPVGYAETECVKMAIPMYSPDGEFDRFNEMQMAGGHGMVMVGYNDEFVTKAGYKGGFILKNSWNNTAYGSYPTDSSRGVRGSHSIEYWMGEVSAEDERYICPNAQDPLNWFSCGLLCKNDGEYAKEILTVMKQPYEFQCIDEDICKKDPVYRYFLNSLTVAKRQPSGRYYDFCMVRLNTLDDTSVEFCFNELPLQVIGLYFTPIDSHLQMLRDSEDYCGYYFFPYEIVQKQIAYFGGFNTIYFDIDWDDSSFMANSEDKKYEDSNFDYQYVNASTGKQNFSKVKFMSSTPYINTRYFDN